VYLPAIVKIKRNEAAVTARRLVDFKPQRMIFSQRQWVRRGCDRTPAVVLLLAAVIRIAVRTYQTPSYPAPFEPNWNLQRHATLIEGTGTFQTAPGEVMAKRAKKKKSATRRTSRPQKKLSDLFHETLKDIYFAENKIIKTLPKMAKAAQSKQLAAAFNKHLRETQGQVKRLDRVFRIIGKPARGKPCEAINGITDEGAEIMREFRGMPALDAGLVAAAQAVEHYEISRYGTLRTWAEQLGMSDAASLLQETLDEEEATDKTLTELATSVINLEAEEEQAEAA
jgi:ferritin-like metal-binding protein YciE